MTAPETTGSGPISLAELEVLALEARTQLLQAAITEAMSRVVAPSLDGATMRLIAEHLMAALSDQHLAIESTSSPLAPTTAHLLAAYRDELHACGFPLKVAVELVLVAARRMDAIGVGPLFLARAEPPAPIVRIDNHKPGSPEEAAE